MSKDNADLVRRAYQAYAGGDLARMLEFVDPGLEWTFLDPGLEHPTRGSAGVVRSWSSCCGPGPSMACGSSWTRSAAVVSW